MTKSKKVFVGVAVIFLVGLLLVSYDISTRTTFPGSKSQLKERLKKQYLKQDSVPNDSISVIQRQ